MTHRLTTNYAKNYCNRTLIVKVIVENVVTCFLLGHSVDSGGHCISMTTVALSVYDVTVQMSLRHKWLPVGRQ